MIRVTIAFVLLSSWAVPSAVRAQDYVDPEREELYGKYMQIPTLIEGGSVCPDTGPLGGPCIVNWMDDGQSFWFVEGQPDQTVIYKADPALGTTEPLFDTERLRAALTPVLGHDPPYRGLPFESFAFLGGGEEAIRFEVEGRAFRLEIGSYSVAALPSDADQVARATPQVVRRGFPSGAPDIMEVPSPDGDWLLSEKDYDLWLRSAMDGNTQVLIDDGEVDYAWQIDGAQWAPDATRVAVMKVDTRDNVRVPIVHWLKQTEDVEFFPYTKAGNPLPTQELHVVDVYAKSAVQVDVGDEDQFVHIVGWRPDGSELLILRMYRSWDHVQVLAADPKTGDVRVVLEETNDSFIRGLEIAPGWRGLMRPLADGEHFLWLSQRDGWDHLYLYDLEGRLVRRLTEGSWPVMGVVHVDEDAGQVYFTAHGEERLYDTHLYRVPVEGGEVTRLTEDPGQHNTVVSPNGAYFVDTHSSTSRPPRTEVRATSGEMNHVVTEADVSGLDDLNWRPPEEFVVKADDGETDLYGLIFKPHDFDPSQSYPVIDYIYNGPFISWVPKTFTDGRGVAQAALAQLGFVVFMVDGRGTTERGKAFQDVAYRNFGRNEIPDHVTAMKNAAATRPWMDLDRVGIYGFSWGGYMTARAMLLAPDFYDVGVAGAGVYNIHDQNAWAIEAYMDLPSENPEGYEYGSSLRLADQLQGKLLLLHGTSDVNATFSATMKMTEALIRAGKLHDLVVLPEQDHSVGGQSGVYFQLANRRYFQEHLLTMRPSRPIS
jgi:dipeptidyl aminopeptidase/acylaminoacyl peptidase